MTNEGRVKKLEDKIKPEQEPIPIGHFNSRDYANEEELNKAIEKWKKEHPIPEGRKGYRGVTCLVAQTGFIGWVWDWWEHEFISPDEMKMRKLEYGSDDYGEEHSAWPEGYVEGRFTEKNRKFIEDKQ